MTNEEALSSPGWRNRFRSFWRKRIQPWWHDYEWPVIGGLGVLGIVLGYVGFEKFHQAHGELRSPLDLLYLTLQLFVLKSGAEAGPKSWELEVARFLIPGLTAYTALQALAVIFHHQIQIICLWFMKGHVVICGLGRKGLLLAKGFHGQGNQVVVIELDENNSLLQHCRDQGIITLIGNGINPELLRKARVHQARYLLCVSGDDGANAEIAVHAGQLVRDRTGGGLTCFVHILEPDLCNLLREREIFAEKVSPFRLEFFNVYDRGARALLKDYLDFDGKWRTQTTCPHLIIIGLGRMGRSLVVHAARSWWERYKETKERLRITIVDKEAERKRDSLCLRYPQLGKVCELIVYQMDIHSPEFKRGEFLSGDQGQCPLTAVHVCFENDSMGLAAGLSIYQQVRNKEIPVIIRMTHDSGLANLLKRPDGNGHRYENLRAFALLDQTCSPELVRGGTHETLGRVIREAYVYDQEKAGKTVQTNPSMVPWEELSPRLIESNRLQADHMGIKLRAVGCGIAPLNDWDARSFPFEEYEIERMAWLEHLRWMEELRGQGWTFGPEKSEEKKTNPWLTTWNQLPEQIKDYDRNTVKKIPVFLAKIDLQAFRLPGKPFGLSLKVVIQDQKDRCLMIKRSKTSTTHPGKWEFPGGKAERGENIEEGLLREVHEETGLTISIQCLAGTAESELPGWQVFHLILEARLESEEVKLSEEHEEYAWVKLRKLPAMDLVDHFRPFAKEYSKR